MLCVTFVNAWRYSWKCFVLHTAVPVLFWTLYFSPSVVAAVSLFVADMAQRTSMQLLIKAMYTSCLLPPFLLSKGSLAFTFYPTEQKFSLHTLMIRISSFSSSFTRISIFILFLVFKCKFILKKTTYGGIPSGKSSWLKDDRLKLISCHRTREFLIM